MPTENEMNDDLLDQLSKHLPSKLLDRVNEALAARQPGVKLAVWWGPMPESNGLQNWTAMLYRKGGDIFGSGSITIDRSEYPDRVRYEADRLRYLIGELEEEPDVLKYDANLHSGYVEQVIEVQGDAHSLAALAATVGAFEYGDPEARYYDFSAEQLVKFAALAARQPVGELHLPPDGFYKIVFDDAEVPDESFARSGALNAALRRFEQISNKWNAHLFVRFANNTRDCTVPNATPAQGIDLGQFREAAYEAWRSAEAGSEAESKINRLLALIDQRDAAPGNTSGD